MGELRALDPEWDPCPRRTGGNLPCELPRHHVGPCGASLENREYYRKFIADVRKRAETMTRTELAKAVEYHLLAWRVLRNEFNAR